MNQLQKYYLTEHKQLTQIMHMNLKEFIFETVKKEFFLMLNELKVYHSSYSNFDKFNHKKYLSNGAGSQAFGWGTYLTDSYEIANDYAENFIILKFNSFIVNADPIKYINNVYDDDIINKAVKMYHDVVRTIIYNNPISNFNANYFDIDLQKQVSPQTDYDNDCVSFEQNKYMMKSFMEDILKTKFDEKSFIEKNKDNYISLRMTKEEYVDKVNKENEVKELLRNIINKIFADAEKQVKKLSYVYEVTIPDDDGSNYIDLNASVSNQILHKITNGLSYVSNRFGDKYNILNKWKAFLNDDVPYGQNIVEKLKELIGNNVSNEKVDKAVSLFLLQCGIIGFRYKAGTIFGLPKGAKDDSINYVIFDANQIKINNKNKYIK